MLLMPCAQLIELHIRRLTTPVPARHSQSSFDALHVAERDIAAGEQILYCYGNLSDAKLLRIYGFVETGVANPHNYVTISTSLLLEACQVPQA
jgi:hypothetical protein